MDNQVEVSVDMKKLEEARKVIEISPFSSFGFSTDMEKLVRNSIELGKSKK